MKIFSMSVWGENPRYIIGAKKNIELAKKFFPEFKVKLYVDKIENFKDFSKEIEIIEITDGSNGAFWRFYPLFENENNIVLVRDSDGRITYREQQAIEEWLKSEKSFHMMYDHEAHYEFPIMAGLFAYKGRLPMEMLEKMEMYKKQYYYTVDQVFLREIVWPFVKEDSLIHSINDENSWFSKTRKELKNKYSFINGWDENDMPLYAPTLQENKSFLGADLPEIFKFDEGIL